MVSVNFNNNVKVYQTGGINKIQATNFPEPVTPVSNPITSSPSSPSFKAEPYRTTLTIRTQLITDDEKKKYKELTEALDGKYKKKLDYALKTGILLKNNSDDRSSVLDNLHKILK